MTMNGWISTEKEYPKEKKVYDPQKESDNEQDVAKYNAKVDAYNAELAKYDADLAKYNAILAEYNTQVIDYNAKRLKETLTDGELDKPLPPFKREIELSRIMREIRKDAKAIILAEVLFNPNIQKQLESMQDDANKNAGSKSTESAINKAKLEILAQILKQLKLNVNITP